MLTLNLRFFGKLVYTSFKQQTTYRAALAAGLATNLFFGLLRAALLQGLYAGATVVNQMTLQDSWTFVGLTQAMIAILFVFGTTDLARSVTTGGVGADLLRPSDFILLWLGRDLGQSLVNLLGRGILFMAFFQFFYPIHFPERLVDWAAFTLSLGLAWLVMFGWRFLANLAAFWTPEARGILRLAFTISSFFSGFIMPLRLLPDWFASLCSLTPFPSTINIPVEIYLGKLQGGELAVALLTQAGWALLLFVICRVVLRAGVRRLVIQGG
jgi:ABC-2 type transport system permease protein